jgi:hypothetical protein
MFAGSIQSIVCHLVEDNSGTTVCGLRISTHVRSRRSGSRLHLLASRPYDCRVCKHCRRMEDGELDLPRPSINDIAPSAIVNVPHVDDFVSITSMRVEA